MKEKDKVELGVTDGAEMKESDGAKHKKDASK